MKEHLDERAMKQYTEMLIEQLQQMKESNWEKPWFSSNSFIIPQNINGRTYSGSNVLMLMFHKQKHDYQLPVYMTWQQAGNMGLAINKGEKSFPISLWNRIIKDENGKRISDQEYNNLSESEQEKCKVIPLQKYFNVFNVEQSNIKTAKPELWDALVKKLQTPAKQMDESNMVKNPALDKMLEDQSWICPIYQEPDSDKACFHKGNDEITVPEKKQFIDGESFYGTLLHEMIHSTGTEERLNRDMSGHFGSVPYAREELVAELGSAMAAINFGINKSIKDESKEYIKSWLDAMQQNPKFLMSVIGDIAKAVDFVNKNIPEIEVAENVEEQQPLETEQSRQEQLNSEEKTEIREKTDEELDNEAYERESEAIDSGHKAHFIAAWKEGEPNNGTFYEVWLKDEDIQNEDGISKYRELPLWNIESMKTAFNIADTFYNKEEMDVAWDEKFAGLAKDFSGLTKPVKAVEQQAEAKPETEAVRQETMYYTSVAYLQNPDDTFLFDKLKEEKDYSQMLTEAAEFDYSHENGIDLAYTHLSAKQNTGDDILDENDTYAIVYNNSVGGTYDILRKTPESEIWKMIQSDYLPQNASKDVRLLAKRKTLEEFDRHPDISHTLEMPNGRKLEWEFDRRDFVFRIGEKENGEFNKVERTIPYDFGRPLDEMLKDVHATMASELRNQISTASDEEPQVKTLEENLRDKLYKGEMTLHDAGAALNKAGKVNYIPDAKETMEVLNKHLEFVTKSSLLSGDGPFKVDEKALMSAVNVGIDVSLRDFAIGLPPTDRRMAMSLAGLVLETTEKNELLSGLIEENLQVDSYKIEKIWSIKESYERDEIDLDYMVRFYTNNLDELLLNKTTHRIGVEKNELEEEQAEVKETEQVSGEEKEESRLDLFQKVVDDTLQGKQVNMPYEVYELLESMTDSELQQAKAIAEKRKGRSNTVKVNMSDIRIKVEQQMKTRADDRNPEQAEKRGYEQTMKSMRDSGTLFMARFDFESYIKRQKTDEEMMVQKNHPGAAAAHQGVIRAAQEYEKILDREIEMLNKATLQHDEMKEQHPDAILLLRTGNSYMIMREDAQAASQVTDLQPKRYPLTKGEQPKEFLAVEFPVSKLDTYLPQMVRAGVRVAICDGIDTPKVSKRQEQETNLDKLQEIIDSTLQGNELPDTLKNLTREMSDDELSKGISMIEENSGSGKKVQENIKTLYSTFRSETEERILNSNLKEAEQKGYEKAMADFNAQPKLLKHSFRYDEFISRHEAEMERYKMDNRPGRVAEQQGIIRAAEEMMAKYSQNRTGQTDKQPEAEEQKPEEKAAESAENRQQQGYKDTIAFFNDHTGEYLKDFDFDHYINEHKEAAAFYGQHGKPLEAAYETGSIQAAEEMKAKYIQSTGEKATQEVAPKLKYFYSGNGISMSEEGDKNYTAFITQDREIKLYKEFHPDNLQKIKQMAETGNMLFRNGNASTDKGYLVLDPVNKPSKIYENPATMERYFLTIEHVDGKELATIGRTVFIDEKDKIDKLMDYTPENMAILEKKADELLETKTQELKNAFRGGDSATIQSASYSYMWASKYKLQQYYNPSKCKEEIKKIQDSIILQKDNKMETTEKKEMKDGISVFKMQNGQYGINETKDGVRTPTRRLHEEDVKAYFEGLKGQTKEEVNRRREVLAEKYLRGNQQAQLAEQTPKKQLEPLSPEHRERLTNASVFKMQDGVSYGVRTQIDGQQHSAKRVKREDIAAFFDGYKGLPKEQQDERKAQLAGMYFKEELTTPKQELSHGMHR